MVWWKDLDGDCVVGTVIPAPVTFVHDRRSGRTTFGEPVGGAPALQLTETEKLALEASLREASPLPLAGIRPGEYLCSACKSWVPADREHWSYGICLSCSLDRDSDRWSD